MAEFILLILLGNNTVINGPALLSGFNSEQSCADAAAKIIAAAGDKFKPNNATPITARYECVEIIK
jgi:hypothetical protein